MSVGTCRSSVGVDIPILEVNTEELVRLKLLRTRDRRVAVCEVGGLLRRVRPVLNHPSEDVHGGQSTLEVGAERL